MSNLNNISKEQLIEELLTLKEENDNLKSSREATQKGEKLARIILDEMYQFAALLDVTGNILEVNKTALDAGGIKLSNIAGKPFWEADWWRTSTKVQGELEEAIKNASNGNFVRYEVQVYGSGAGKDLIWIDFSLIPVKDKNEKVIYLLAEGRNITEKKLAEEEVLRQKEQITSLYQKLKEFDELKTQFFANVSHELRTPLALILGPIKNVLNNKALSEVERNNLQVVERNARMLLKQVNDLLDISKLEAGKMEVKYIEADIANLVRLVSSNFEVLSKDNQIVFSIQTPSTLLAEFDPDKIQRVVLNLLSNAFKFTPVGGIVKCILESSNDKAMLYVSDSGPGINKENREAIFERFRQIEGGTTRKLGGTGLGLAIVKDFLELHEGTIRVEEADEGGALFIVEIPIKALEGKKIQAVTGQEAEYVEDITSSVLDEIRLIGKRSEVNTANKNDNFPLILVVEDNPDLNSFITQTLSSEFRVISAMDGQEGLEKALMAKPDLILSDVMMPRMSGDQMVEEFRKHKEVSNIPIIMLTAKADDGLRVRMLSGGAQDYLVKPFSSEELKARARNLISLKLANEELTSFKEKLANTNFQLEDKIQERTKELTESNEQLEMKAAALLQSEGKLKESEERFRTIAENIPNLAFMGNGDGYISWYNKKWLEYTGTTPEPMEGWGWQSVLDPTKVNLIVDTWKDSISSGKPFEMVLSLKGADGLYRPFLTRVLPVKDEKGSIIRWFGTNTDISEQIKGEEDLKQKNAQLTKINSDLDNFIYTASHDLKSPISNIEGLIAALPETVSPQILENPEFFDIMGMITKSLNRFKNTIQDLTDISRIQKNVSEEESDINICEIIEDAKISLNSEIENSEAIINLNIESCPIIHYSKRNFHSIIYNLLSNALKYRSPSKKPIIHITTAVIEEHIILTIEDNGLGVDPRKTPQMFEMFKRLHDHVAGTGIGLYIVKRIIENNGGKIEVESEVGNGTIFSIYFKK